MRWVILASWMAGVVAAQEPPPSHPAPEAWTRLEPGLDYAEFDAPCPSDVGDSRIRVLRIDPGRFDLVLLNASNHEGRNRTAREWSGEFDLVAAINASMFQADHATSVSLMRTRDHVNNGHVSKDKTVLAFDPDPGVEPRVRMIDRACDDLDQVSQGYGALVQSIRMVSCEGHNVWSPQPRRWSTAAVGVDRDGRVLFVHVRSPYVTHDLIEMLLALPLDLDRCMYVEGGPEAQLYVRDDAAEMELVGSFETGFMTNNDNAAAWPVPNVIGVVRRGPP